MLVLAIMLVLASLAWPRVEGLLERHRLSRAAEEVRQSLAACRLQAQNDGYIYQFLYEPGGHRYSVEPLVADPSGSAMTVLAGELPESITFDADPGMTSGQSFSLPMAGAASGSTTGGQSSTSLGQALSGQPSAVPILFMPDGTADDASIVLVDEVQRRIRLTVRGLTASVVVAQSGSGGHP
jgi:hypothetical protein